MKTTLAIITLIVLLIACSKEDREPLPLDNPLLDLSIPAGFPELNPAVRNNLPTKYGVELGQLLFEEKKFSGDNSISCASCHHAAHAFADDKAKAIGIYGRVGLRNTPPIQNMAFMRFYNWDGNILQLEKQPLVPIITHEEMNSSILEVIAKIGDDPHYKALFGRAFGDEQITPDRIYRSMAQYAYSLLSFNSKYDRVKRREGATFTADEERGYAIFQQKCASCHATELFTDQTFRNIGFPLNPNTEEAGRARVTGNSVDYMAFRVPSLRNIEKTAPYGSFGQFATLQELLDYMGSAVLAADNLDPIFKEQGNKIPLDEQEKKDIIAFLTTLTDSTLINR